MFYDGETYKNSPKALNMSPGALQMCSLKRKIIKYTISEILIAFQICLELAQLLVFDKSAWKCDELYYQECRWN